MRASVKANKTLFLYVDYFLISSECLAVFLDNYLFLPSRSPVFLFQMKKIIDINSVSVYDYMKTSTAFDAVELLRI